MTASKGFRDVAQLVRRAHEGGAFSAVFAEYEGASAARTSDRAYGAIWRRYRRKCQTVVLSLMGWRGNPLARLTAELVVDRFLEKGVLLGDGRQRQEAWKGLR